MQPVAALTSPNYRIEEDFVGGSGTSESSSANFKSQDTFGGPAVGPSSSANFGNQSGATSTNDPTLSFSIDTTAVNLGALSTSITKTGTASFSVLNYTSHGYVVQVIGSTPNNGAHSLTGLSSASSSSIGTEQFGINLKANTSPTTFGSEASQVPDNTFSFGGAATGYNTANLFKYTSGDVIAAATKSSGKTVYTISYIANMSNNTPGGSYSSAQTLICTGTY